MVCEFGPSKAGPLSLSQFAMENACEGGSVSANYRQHPLLDFFVIRRGLDHYRRCEIYCNFCWRYPPRRRTRDRRLLQPASFASYSTQLADAVADGDS